MLLGRGVYAGMRSSLRGSSVVGDLSTLRPIHSPVSWRRTFGSDIVSFPVGYFQNGIVLPMKYGGIACVMRGSGGLSGSVEGPANCAATLSGSGSVAGSAFKGINGSATLSGSSSLAGSIAATANLQCRIVIGAQPSAFDIAQAIWGALASQYNAPGTMGAKLNGAASAGDPWSTELPGSYPVGSAGNLLGNQTANGGGLTLAQFLALK